MPATLSAPLVRGMPLAGGLARAGQAAHPLGVQPGAVGWWAAAAMAAVALLALALLRRRPFTALALLLAGALAALITPGRWFIAFPLALPAVLLLAGVAVCFIAATRPARVSLTAALVALGVLAGGWAVWPRIRLTPAFFFGASPELAVALIMIIAWLAGHSIRQAHTHAEALHAQAEAQAVTAHRLQLARDLHDQVAHAIGIIAIQAGAGARVIDTQPAQARDALAAIEATSRHTLAGLGQTVRSLRQAGPHPPPGTASPGLAGLGQLTTATRDAGVHVEVHWQGQRRPLPADVDTCAFRIIQESVTNVVRHARTPRCRVSIDQREDELAIEVTDDGRGSTTAGSGYGIVGMRERAALLHGKLTAGPRPEGGFRVAARLPVPAAAR